MAEALPILYLVRHGETAWTITGHHAGLIDIPLTERGEGNARNLAAPLRGVNFVKVFSSPLIRASRTCELAGFQGNYSVDPDLVEWNYGEYEGKTTEELLERHPGWRLFFDGCPGGESVEQVGIRADRVVARVRNIEGNVLLFSSGHFLRVLAARWIGLGPEAGRFLGLSTTSLSALGYEAYLFRPVVQLWNDTGHLDKTSLLF